MSKPKEFWIYDTDNGNEHFRRSDPKNVYGDLYTHVIEKSAYDEAVEIIHNLITSMGIITDDPTAQLEQNIEHAKNFLKKIR